MPNIAPPEDKFVKINGLNIHYVDWGGNSDKVLLFVHGQGGNGHNFDHIAPEFREEYRVLAIDQRGHGDSDHTWEGYAVKLFGAELASFAETLGIIPFDLVGTSLGARNGIPLAGEYPDYLKHLVCVDYGPEMDVGAARAQVSRIGGRRLGWRTKEDYITEQLQSSPRAAESVVRHNADYALRLNYADHWVLKQDPELFWINGSFGAKEVPYLWEQWARIKCAILELKGGLSDYLSPTILERMRQIQPTMELVVVPNSGHGVSMENPNFMIQEVKRFLKKESPVAVGR